MTTQNTDCDQLGEALCLYKANQEEDLDQELVKEVADVTRQLNSVPLLPLIECPLRDERGHGLVMMIQMGEYDDIGQDLSKGEQSRNYNDNTGSTLGH